MYLEITVELADFGDTGVAGECASSSTSSCTSAILSDMLLWSITVVAVGDTGCKGEVGFSKASFASPTPAGKPMEPAKAKCMVKLY